MNEVLLIIFRVLFWIAEVGLIYNMIFFVIGLLPHKQKYPLIEDKQKFCIFVPCHNEGPVVGATVNDYVNINYNKELFDIFFIADNCTDNTADVLRESIKTCGMENFHVLERHVDDPKKKGKPHALRWGIELLEKEDKFYNKYDMFMILDADNFVDADILKHINSQYLSYKENKRPVMIQTYLDSKNKNTLVSRGYYQAYRITNGFWQLSKQRLGLVPAVGGTGFAMSIDFLKDIGGYNCTSLTEDLEIQTKAILRNKWVAYNGNVRIYDEKPTRLKQSIVQRTRWAQGHWFIFFKYAFVMLFSLFDIRRIKSFFKKIDNIIYLSFKLILLSSALLSVLSICLVANNYKLLQGLGVVAIFNVIAFIFSILIIPIASLYDGTKREKKNILKDFIPNIIAIAIVGLIDMWASVIGLFKCGNQRTWKKTTHRVTSIKEGKYSSDNSKNT